jgi:probable HAF family extracellular repeat protein
MRPPAFALLPATAGMLLAASSTWAQTPTIINLGTLPGASYSSAAAVSANGAVVAGTSGYRAFRWTLAGGMEDLGTLPGGINSQASAVSADGSIVVGSSVDLVMPWEYRSRAFRWATPTGMEDLGTAGGLHHSSASGVSGDGSIITGVLRNPPCDPPPCTNYYVSFRWTEAGGMVILETQPAWSSIHAAAAAISRSSEAIIGTVDPQQQCWWPPCPCSPAQRAFRWTAAGGMQNLGAASGLEGSAAYAINADGSLIAGTSWGCASPAAVSIWKASGGMQNLGSSSGFNFPRPLAISDGGASIVGVSDLHSSEEVAFLWTRTTGMVDLNQYLPTLGLDLTGWLLTSASGLSADGGVIVGDGYFDNETRAWMVHLGAPCYANCDQSTTTPILNVEDFTCFINAFAAAQSLPHEQQFAHYANCDDSTIAPIINIDDFTCFINAFAEGCP